MAKHVKSNAIVIAKNLATPGRGRRADEPRRLDAHRHREGAAPTSRARSIGSDAFFPFPDAIELAIQNGVTAFMQPGGSKGDEAAVETCDEHGAAMVFTGRRHFLH